MPAVAALHPIHAETRMANYPPKLQEYLDDFGFITSREDRVDYLI